MLRKKPERQPTTIGITKENREKVERLMKKYNLKRDDVINGILEDYNEDTGHADKKQKN